MAHVLMGGTREFNSLMYPEKHPTTIAYLQGQLSNFSQTLNQAGQTFLANSAEMIESYIGHDAVRLARAAIKKFDNLLQKDVIKYVWELGDRQNVKPKMQRWIMAEPTVRQMYFDQRLDGYSETYVDMHPGDIGEKHYDYRRVFDGVVVDTSPDENGDVDWKATVYVEDLIEGDRDLTLSEKVDVMLTMEQVAEYIKAGQFDPTSIWNNKL